MEKSVRKCIAAFTRNGRLETKTCRVSKTHNNNNVQIAWRPVITILVKTLPFRGECE